MRDRPWVVDIPDVGGTVVDAGGGGQCWGFFGLHGSQPGVKQSTAENNYFIKNT